MGDKHRAGLDWYFDWDTPEGEYFDICPEYVWIANPECFSCLVVEISCNERLGDRC